MYGIVMKALSLMIRLTAFVGLILFFLGAINQLAPQSTHQVYSFFNLLLGSANISYFFNLASDMTLSAATASSLAHLFF
jgi:hypothetical protein